MNTAYIKKRLYEIGKTQSDLANALKVNPSAITRALKGERSFKEKEITIIAKLLEIPVEKLLYGESDKHETRSYPYPSIKRTSLNMHAEAIFIAQESLKSRGRTERSDIKHLAEKMCAAANLIGTEMLTTGLAEWIIQSENFPANNK